MPEGAEMRAREAIVVGSLRSISAEAQIPRIGKYVVPPSGGTGSASKYSL